MKKKKGIEKNIHMYSTDSATRCSSLFPNWASIAGNEPHAAWKMTTPAYSLLQLDCPTQRSLPRAQLDKRKRFDHDKSLKRLANAQKVFTKKAFWIDVAILDRMYYKLINSQRMFPRFRIMSQVEYTTKRISVERNERRC